MTRHVVLTYILPTNDSNLTPSSLLRLRQADGPPRLDQFNVQPDTLAFIGRSAL